jgi:hypothetical protein
MQVSKVTENKRLAVFKNDYELRMGLKIEAGDEFVLGRGFNEYSLDEDGSLVLFVGEFTPHRVPSKYFNIVDEMKVTTVDVYRKNVGR